MAIPPEQPIRILMVDDHPIFRAGVRMLIEVKPHLKVVGEASNHEEALLIAACELPDVILLDLDLGGSNSLHYLPELLKASPKSNILILTGMRDSDWHRQALQLGAKGLILKENTSEGLIEAIERVHVGESSGPGQSPLSPNLLKPSQTSKEEEQKREEAAKITYLTKRERQIIALICEGLKNQQVADSLLISEGTVRNHLTVIFEKLGLSGRFELIVFAHRHGLQKGG